MKNDNCLTTKAGFFLVGAGIGAVVALLFAPKSGQQLRSDISDTTKQGIDFANKGVETISKKASDIIEGGKTKANDLLDIGKGFIENQKEAFGNVLEESKQIFKDKAKPAVAGRAES